MNLIIRHNGPFVNYGHICRLLKRYGYTRKIIRRIALQRSVDVRSLYLAQSYMYDSRCFIWLDETGNDRRNFLRKYGYALRAQSQSQTLGLKYCNLIDFSG